MSRQRPSLSVVRDPLQGRGAHALRRRHPHPRSGMVPVPLQHPKGRNRRSPAPPCLAPPPPLWLEVVVADAWHLVARVFPHLVERSAELGVAPYEDTPRKHRDAFLPPSSSTAAEDSSPATPPPESPPRVGDTNWCDCGRCTAMPTTRECFCCRELPQAVRKQPAECIRVHTDFFKLCLDVAVLAVAYCEVREKGLEHSHELHETVVFSLCVMVMDLLDLVYLVTALVPSATVCLASSPGSSGCTAIWFSRLAMVERL
ncbi:P2X purinoceptor 7 [Ixodes scapularis]